MDTHVNLKAEDYSAKSPEPFPKVPCCSCSIFEEALMGQKSIWIFAAQSTIHLTDTIKLAQTEGIESHT